jgi:hypothetical protein
MTCAWSGWILPGLSRRKKTEKATFKLSKKKIFTAQILEVGSCWSAQCSGPRMDLSGSALSGLLRADNNGSAAKLSSQPNNPPGKEQDGALSWLNVPFVLKNQAYYS